MGTEITDYSKAWADDAKKVARREKTTSTFLSVRGGQFKLGKDEIEGNGIVVVIADSVFENAYYDERYNPENITPPKCFAMAREQEDLAPHPAMQDAPEFFEAQSGECRGCPMNEWGSADTGKGKACGNRRRLALVPAGKLTLVKGTRAEYQVEYFEDEEDYLTGEIVLLKIPITSVKEYSRYVNDLYKEHQRPPHSVITRIDVVPDAKTQFKLRFELVELLPGEFYDTLQKKHIEASKLVAAPYTAPDKDEQSRRANKVGGLEGLRK